MWAAGLVLFFGLLGALLIGAPIAISLGATGLSGIIYAGSPEAWIVLPSGVALHGLARFELLAIPLFILMSAFITEGGIGHRLIDAASKWMSAWPGYLHSAGVLACAAFAAMSGSSVATATAIGGVVLPEIKKRGHHLRLGIGAVAAGGTLGILIPPSNQFILYGVLTETSISKLFMAGVIPGIMMTAIFLAFNTLLFWLRPNLAPRDEQQTRVAWPERWASLRATWSGMVLIICVIGGIFLGVVTPTEAAGLGAAVAMFLGLFGVRALNLPDIVKIAIRAVQTTAMLGFIIYGGLILGRAVTLMDLSFTMVDFVTQSGFSRWEVMIAINVLLLILGLFLDASAIMLLTVPLLFPAVKALGFDPIWFGVVLCLNMEIALITPPVGLNIIVLMGITGTSMKDAAIGAFPYFLLLLLGLVLVMAFPALSLWLPSQM